MTADNAYRLKTMYAVDPPEKAWKQFSALFDLTPLKMEGNRGAIENHTWIAGSSIFAQVSLDGNLHTHGNTHLSSSGNLLFVHRYLEGGADGQSGDVPYMMRPGMMIFHDYGRPFEGIQLPSKIQSVYLNHDSVGYDPKRMPPQIVFDPNTPEGAALFASFDELMTDLLDEGEILEKTRVRDLMGQVNASLPEPGAPLSEQMLIQKYIDKHLTNPDLSETDLQSAFHISRSQLFEHLSAFGGFAYYLKARRAFHALHEVNQRPNPSQHLERAATAWGFANIDAFREAVEQVYRSDLDTIFDA